MTEDDIQNIEHWYAETEQQLGTDDDIALIRRYPLLLAEIRRLRKQEHANRKILMASLRETKTIAMSWMHGMANPEWKRADYEAVRALWSKALAVDESSEFSALSDGPP